MNKQQDKLFVDIIDKGISIYWNALAQARNMKLFSEDIEWVMSDDRSGPERIFNVRISSVNAEQRIDKIIAEIENGTLPDSLLITQNSTPAEITGILRAKGFSIDTSSPGMVLDLAEFEAPTHSTPFVEIKKVDCEEYLQEWVGIVNNEFTIMSYEQFHDIYMLPHICLYLSINNGTPSGSCMTVTGKMDEVEFVSLEMVNTLKEYQRKGIGTAMLNHVLGEHKKRGTRYVTLRSSVEGIRLYTRLGFREYDKRILASYDSNTAGTRRKSPQFDMDNTI